MIVKPSCPTCKGKKTKPEPNGWGGLVETWWCWQCNWCKKMVCNAPTGEFTCYVKHTSECHPEQGK